MLHRIALFIALFSFSTLTFAVEVGDIAPPFEGVDEVGANVSFPAVIDGKPTIMVFWATWCAYCKAFMPFLEDIQKDYGTDKINVVLINHKERGAGDPAAYTKTLNFEQISVMEGDSIGDAYSVDFIPGLMIAGADGRMAWKRKSTDLPAGQKVGAFCDMKVREQLDNMLAAN
jgi:thiol-disulfide isomerase/thioredoxin